MPCGDRQGLGKLDGQQARDPDSSHNRHSNSQRTDRTLVEPLVRTSQTDQELVWAWELVWVQATVSEWDLVLAKDEAVVGEVFAVGYSHRLETCNLC